MKRTPRFVAALSLVVTAACSPGGASPSVGGGSPSVSSAPTAAPTPTQHTATIVASVSLEGHPAATQVAFGSDEAWIRFVDGSVARVDLETQAIVATIPVGSGEFGSLAVGQDAVWVTTFAEDKVSRIDPATNTVVAEIAVGAAPEGIAVTPGAVWVSNHHGGSIWRLDTATNVVVARIEVGAVGSSGPKWLQIAFDSVWTSVPNSSSVVRVDPATNAVIASIDVPDVEELVIGDDFLYATDVLGRISEIDPALNEVVRSPARGDTPWLLAVPWVFGGGAFWAPDGSDLLRLDPLSFAPTEVWHVAGVQSYYATMAFNGDLLWLLTADALIGIQFAG